MPEVASLTQAEAAERAALIDVQRYDIDVDMRGLLEGDTLESVSTITFTCREPGAEHVRRLRRRRPLGHPQRSSASTSTASPTAGSRSATWPPTTSWWSAPPSPTPQAPTGILRTVDPSDKLVYVWTSFEPDAARRVWACFDQPDLKAPHRFTVLAPDTWTGHQQLRARLGRGRTPTAAGGGSSPTPRRCRRTSSSSTPGRSTRSARSAAATASGSTAASRSSSYLERDAAHLFELTAQGLAFFGEQFGQPFPQERYDQVFVPNMGGAMENWGCVTWTDSVLYRSAPTHGQREDGRQRAAARDGAHVVRRPGDHAVVGRPVAQRGVRVLGLDLGGGQRDASSPTLGHASWPASSSTATGSTWARPPTRSAARSPDVAQAMANFDAITYVKGQSTLQQLAAYVGEDGVRRGAALLLPRPRVGQHPARRPDLRGRRRLRAGPVRLDDRLARPGRHRHPHPRPTASWWPSAPTAGSRGRTGSTSAPSPRGTTGLVRVGTTAVETDGPAHARPRPARGRPAPGQRRRPHVRRRPHRRGIAADAPRARRRPARPARPGPSAVATAWDMLVKGELAADDLLDLRPRTC